ncbi:MAG TPA: ABC-type transport auxiliary lipoprotein family protein [Steroidobacteraceae bacterium]|nr:ABC-type transport auxiliary lipoprotein family protein [Steroidobacteraceae bacterium]
MRWGAATTLLAVCVGVSGCSGLFRSNAKPEQIYYLRAPSAPGTAAPAASVSMRVVRPVAGPGLDSTHIMLVQADHRMNFFSGARWPAPAPELIESLAVQTLRASGGWASVQDSASPFPADYLLQMHVRRFEADYTAGGAAPLVQVVLDCTVGRRQGREVLATFTVARSAAASANQLSQVVAAFEQATGTALDALAQQSVQAARLDAQHADQNEAQPPPSPDR